MTTQEVRGSPGGPPESQVSAMHKDIKEAGCIKAGQIMLVILGLVLVARVHIESLEMK